METGSGQPPERPTSSEPGQPPSPYQQPRQPPPSQQPPSSSPPPQKPKSGQKLSERLRQPRIAAAIGIGLGVLIILILVLSGGGDDGGDSEEVATAEAREVSVEELRDLAAGLDQPVYWAGEQEDKRYELTESEDGNIFVRYLDPDTEVGSTEVASLTVGTYPLPDAYGALQKSGKQKGALKGETPDGGLVVSNQDSASSVYIAYPGSDIQIEVFDPNPQVAFETATSGEIEPIQ